LSEGFSKVIDGVGQLADDEATEFVSDTSKDPVLGGLEPILAARVGKELSDTEFSPAAASSRVMP
jgi:hypothetical protein